MELLPYYGKKLIEILVKFYLIDLVMLCKRMSQRGNDRMTEQKNIIVYGTTWCPDCFRTRHFLDKHAIQYQWINIDKDRDGEVVVLKINHGMRSVPTILFGDGTILVEPTNADLASKLEIVKG
jgi:glutaredoxin